MPLTQEERTELEAIIRREHKRLMSELREEIEQSRQETFGAVEGGVGDSADESVADLLSDLDSAEITRDLGDIRALEAAMGAARGRHVRALRGLRDRHPGRPAARPARGAAVRRLPGRLREDPRPSLRAEALTRRG